MSNSKPDDPNGLPIETNVEDDGLSLASEDEDETGLPIEDRGNQAGTEQMDPEKFKRD